MTQDATNDGDGFVRDYFRALGIEADEAEPVADEDGTIYLAIGDQAVAVQYQPSLNGALISGVVMETHGIAVEDIAIDLLLLNGQIEESAGLVFGMSDRETITASLIVPAPFMSPETLAEATGAFVEGVERWQAIIEESLRRAVHDPETDDAALGVAEGPSGGSKYA